MFKINIFFMDEMLQKNKSFSPSSFKPKLVKDDWIKNFENIEIKSFKSLNLNDFYLIHDKTYVDNIFGGLEYNGFGEKDKNFSSTFPYTSGSLYAAAEYALNNMVSVSPTSGFHHAHFSKSEGFCTFNGLVLTAQLLKDRHSLNNIGILDFDMHYGNGTDNIIRKKKISYITHYSAGKYYDLYFPLLNIFKPIIKYFYNKLFDKKTISNNNETAKPKLRQFILKDKGDKFLQEIPKILNNFKGCNLIIYQAGADQHIDDPYGGLLTYEQLEIRDYLVFNFAKKNNIPIVWNLAGGYQKDSNGTIEPILLCHRNTMKICLNIFSKNE